MEFTELVQSIFSLITKMAILISSIAAGETAFAADCTAIAGKTSISQCLNQAGPGDTITVVGTHNGSITLSGKKGTKDRPIRLVGGQGARIIGSRKAAAIYGSGVDYFEIRGLHITSNAPDGDGDVGAIKLMGSWTDSSEGILIAGNWIDGTGQDAIKLFRNTAQFAIIGNLIDGDWRQETIDCFSCRNGIIAFNTTAITNKTAYNVDLYTKGGASYIAVQNNEFNVAINCGGHGNSGPYDPTRPSEPPPSWNTEYFMAHHLTFTNNRAGRAGLAGCWDSSIINNTLKNPNVSSSTGSNQTKNQGNTLSNNSNGASGPIGVAGWNGQIPRTPSTPIELTASYTFAASHSNLCLGTISNSTSAGVQIAQRSCDQPDSQSWRLIPIGNSYCIKSVKNGLCLDLPSDGTSNGTLIKQYSCDLGKSQQFTLEKVPSGGVRFHSVLASGRCFDIKDASTADGAPVQLWNCKDAGHQKFKMNRNLD